MSENNLIIDFYSELEKKHNKLEILFDLFINPEHISEIENPTKEQYLSVLKTNPSIFDNVEIKNDEIQKMYIKLNHKNIENIKNISDENLRWLIKEPLTFVKSNDDYRVISCIWDPYFLVRSPLNVWNCHGKHLMMTLNFCRFYETDKEYFFQTIYENPNLIEFIFDRIEEFKEIDFEKIIKLVLDENLHKILMFENESFYEKHPEYKKLCHTHFMNIFKNKYNSNGYYDKLLLNRIKSLHPDCQKLLLKEPKDKLIEIIKNINNPIQELQDYIMNENPDNYKNIRNPSNMTKDKYIQSISSKVDKLTIDLSKEKQNDIKCNNCAIM